MSSRRDQWNERYAAKDLVWSAEPNRTLVDLVEKLPPGRALDVGCGEGRNAIWLAERGWRVTAIDFSDVGIDKARRIALARGVDVDWRVGDVSTADLPDAECDLVLVLFLHTGPEERARWLAKAVAAVRPGGTFVYVGHDPSNITHGVGGPQHPMLLPGVDEIRAALEGFRIDRAEVIERTVASDPGHGGEGGVALDTCVCAVRTAMAG